MNWASDLRDRLRRRGLGLWLVVGAALALRLVYWAVAVAGDPLVGDAQYYSGAGAAVAGGHGFTTPVLLDGRPSAEHPPLPAIVLALGPLLVDDDAAIGDQPWFVVLQQLTMVGVGVAAVAMVGVAARRSALGSKLDAPRVGVAAASVAAVHPALWINDGLLMSESLTALAVATVLWAAAVQRHHPSVRHAALLGATIGVAALVRAELVALAIAAVAIIALAARRQPGRRRGPLAAQAAGLVAACAAVCATWVAPNLVRFDEPVVFATNDGITLLGANCPDTLLGRDIGLWSPECLRFFDSDGNGIDDLSDRLDPDSTAVDPSVLSGNYRSAAFGYMAERPAYVARAGVVRMLRTWGAWNPAQMARYNEGEGRDVLTSWLALLGHVAATSAAVCAMRRRRRDDIDISWFVAIALLVTMTSAAVYGIARFRVPWDAAACILAGMAVVGWRNAPPSDAGAPLA